MEALVGEAGGLAAKMSFQQLSHDLVWSTFRQTSGRFSFARVATRELLLSPVQGGI